MNFLRYRAHVCVLTVIVLSLSIPAARAQGLQVGDQILDVELQQVLNYTRDNARLKDFNKGKALLIDFWFTTCSSCIESFPKLDSLQKEFGDDLNILLVTFETKEKTLTTFNTINRIKHVKLPSVIDDTLMHLIFPHRSAPHEIWVDKDSKIKAITDHTSINRENIRSLIAGKDLNLPIKKDNMEYSSYSRSPVSKNADMEKTIKYSYLSSYQPGLGASEGMYVDFEDGLFLYAKVINCHFQSLYAAAYNKILTDFNFNRMIIDKSVSDRLHVVVDKRYLTVEEDNQNTYCYEKWWRDTTRANACQEMQTELDRFFNVKSYTEKRKMPCIVLKETGTQKRYISNNPAGRQDNYYDKDTFYIENVILKYLVRGVFNSGRFAWSPYHFIDETGYEGRMTIKLPQKFESIDQVNRFLKDYDLKVVLEKRRMDVIVIKEAKKNKR